MVLNAQTKALFALVHCRQDEPIGIVGLIMCDGGPAAGIAALGSAKLAFASPFNVGAEPDRFLSGFDGL